MPKKIKLLFRNRSLEMGGTENVLLTILHELDKSEYEITLLLNYHQGEFLNRVPKEVRVLSIGKGVDEFSNNKYLKLIQKSLRRLKYAWFQKFPKTFYQQHHLMDMDYEVAFSHYMYDDILNSPNRKSKKIYWFHGDLRNSGFSEQGNLEIIKKMKQFNQGVFVSQFSKNIVEQTWNVQLENAGVIHNPLSTKQILEKAEEAPLQDFGKIDFISIGRLFWQKGFKDLVLAHKKLIEEGHNIRTLILGDGPQKAELTQLIQENNLQDSLILGGYQGNPFPYLKKAQYFVLPSYSEGYPLVIAEALLLNTYVLSTNVGGIAEMITSDQKGILFDPGVEPLYQAMKQVLETPPLINEKLGQEIISKNKEIFQKINELFHS
ncbi:glycosyltransferase [Elizabethkingia sp. JS20170427COW]|uniref:glycosyltransferase n=1 Tax=Elizabethkingia sp. JS20170427COW TaxID=2583851 RepID=UPI001110ABEB|nr:glycosyltransferase [Elizabethkingia sp. JS20170427COW]QCX53422.1 glycosyltransferase [Elizabethkingia sp. JS20170427COW]